MTQDDPEMLRRRNQAVMFRLIGMLDVALGVAAISLGRFLSFDGPDTGLTMSIVGVALILPGAGIWWLGHVMARRIGRGSVDGTVVRTRR